MYGNRTKELIEIIKANPGCVVRVDNDCWYIYANTKRRRMLAEGDGRNGWQVLLALAAMAGVTIEEV